MERQQHSVTEMLNENNYGSWSINMEKYLVARGLWGAVTGRDGSNEDGWARRNAAALRAIRVNCSAEIFERIGDVSTAKYAWDALKKKFGDKNGGIVADLSGPSPSNRDLSDRAASHHELYEDLSSEGLINLAAAAGTATFGAGKRRQTAGSKEAGEKSTVPSVPALKINAAARQRRRMKTKRDEECSLPTLDCFFNADMNKELQMQPPITEKLHGANYTTWKANMTNYLEAQDLWGVVTGEELREQNDRKSLLEWKQKNDAALRAIQNNCSEKISEMIDNAATSKHAWEAFLTLFSREEEIIEPESLKFGPSNQEKLNGENFRIWRGKMKIQLEAEGVWDVVTGKKMRGEIAGEWTIKNAKALRAIRINCGETILPMINDVCIAEHAWKTLLKRFRSSPLGILQPKESGPVNRARSNHDPKKRDELMRYIGSEDMTNIAGKGMNGNEVVIRENGYTALHVAVSARKLAVVECFLGNESIRAPMVDKKKRTALALAAYHGKLEIVKKLVHKYPTWLFIKDNRGNIPLVAACEGGHVDTTRFLYKETFKYLSEARAQVYEEDYESTRLIRKFDDTEYCVILKCLESKMLGIALEVLRHNKKTVLFNSSSAPLLMLAEKPKAFWKRRVYKGINQTYTHDCALEILKIMCGQISPLNDIDLGRSNASRAMFAAVENGNLEFVIEIIKTNPSMRWMLNDNNRDLLTCSIENRQENIANFLYGREESTDALVRFEEDKSNLLHVAAKIAPDFQLSRVSGAALHMQRELKWFKEVDSIVPDYFKESKNELWQTPADVFTKEHEKLLEKAEKWMKDTASYYSIVGALIITIMFATAFTVPGGNDQNEGVPLFRHKVLFKIFIMLATTSFSAASTSVMVFLGILTSRYAEQDFLVSLPRKLMVGMFTLFISMTVMMAAYSVAIVLMFEGKQWTIIVMVILGSIPVLCFAGEHLPLLKEIFVSTQWRVFSKKRTPYYTWPRARSSNEPPAETTSTNNNEAPPAETVVEISTL